MAGSNAYRIIPSIEQLRQRASVAALEQAHGHEATVDALRAAAETIRREIAEGKGGGSDAETVASRIEQAAAGRLTADARGSLRPALNATGVVIHTNLGRAPLARAALDRLDSVARGYSNLEYDVDKGSRGSRSVHAERLLTKLTGADAAIVVNNNAAATMLILAGLASGREVIISRGELVEIGGGFRVPDVLTQSGALLREIGTTNRTRAADYQAAIGEKTALILRVHPSNFRIEGFTERPALEVLVAIARERDLPLVEDLGSGSLSESFDWEPTVQSSIACGADLVCFSGDKLLGGPQAGIIVGRGPLVARLRHHPLMRALRVDKLTLAALEGTLLEYVAGRAHESVPVVRMIQLDADSIKARARTIAEKLDAAGWSVTLVSGASAIGGGSAPGIELPTVLLGIEHEGRSALQTQASLRLLEPPVIARIEDGRVVLDLRTIDPADDERLADMIAALMSPRAPATRGS